MSRDHDHRLEQGMAYLVSRSQTAFSSFIFGREEKGSRERPIQFLFSKSPLLGIL